MFCQRGFTVLISCMVILNVQSSHGSEIIGGKEVKPHSMPYMALLISREICGGILINQSWVLTAAHCPDMNKVLLGVHSYKAKESESRQVQMVKKHIRHPDYNKKQKTNDLMLLKLNKPVKETNTVKVHNLSTTVKDPKAGTICVVAGWGTTDPSVQKMSDVLMSVSVTVVDRVKCNSPDYYNRKPVITSSMICAGSDGKMTADTCGGDSGGPLLCNGALVGVTSFGPKKCGEKPGVYSFLSEKQLKWITNTMKKSEI